MPEGQKTGEMEIGIYTLGDLGADPLTGKAASPYQRFRDIIEAAKLADEAGLDIFGVGEHHRLDYAVSSPAVLLAAIASHTQKIRLASAATILCTVDPVRLFEDFATLDLLSGGRAEIIAGRGAFMESYPLFGYDIGNCDELFAENLELLMELNRRDTVTWQGTFRAPLANAMISPRPLQRELPIWIGVGASEESAANAGKLGLGLAAAILSGDPLRFKQLVDLYKKAALENGREEEQRKIAVTGHSYISGASLDAKNEFYPYYSNYRTNVSRQRGQESTVSRKEFDEMSSPAGALFVGSPQEIIEKILKQHELFGHTRFMAQMDIGGMPHRKWAKSIELLATEVAPAVRRETRKRSG